MKEGRVNGGCGKAESWCTSFSDGTKMSSVWSLAASTLWQIFSMIMLNNVFKRLKEKEITLDVTDRFKDKVVDEGFSPAFGARPLRRAIMRLLEDNLAEKMLSGDIAEGTSAIMDVNAEGEIIVMTGDGKELSTTAYTGSSGMG